MNYPEFSDTLEHHGIKGQKWGVRRTPEQLGRRIESLQRRKHRMTVKAGRKRLRSDKAARKANKLRTYLEKNQGLLSDEERGRKEARLDFLTRRSYRLRVKADRRTLRAAKADRKINKLNQQLRRALSEVSNEQINAGRQAVNDYLESEKKR